MVKNAERALYRIVDANLNRASEGVRVCEEIVRFVRADARCTRSLRQVRHAIGAVRTSFPAKKLLGARAAGKDPGRRFTTGSIERSDWADVFTANVRRASESMRVLEEVSKLVGCTDGAGECMKIRYRLYELEKRCGIIRKKAR